MLLERGIVVSYETVRRWALKFGPAYVRRLRRKTPSRLDIWHLDEVVVTISGEKHWLWRAVDQGDYVLDEIVHTRRDNQGGQAHAEAPVEESGRPTPDQLRRPPPSSSNVPIDRAEILA
jgi:putative transposase